VKMSSRLAGILLLWAACLLQPTVSSAVTRGQIDDFQDGTTQGWQVGDAGTPPLNVADGGPAGAGDHYLLLTATGGVLQNSKLAVFNQIQWAGNYLAAHVNAISMWVNNLGASDLALRLYVADGTARAPANAAISTLPVLLPAGSGWTAVLFPITPADLTLTSGPGSSVQTALTSAVQLRILHNPNPTTPSSAPAVAASLGVDNIQARRRGPLTYLPLLLLDD
jgi:hypothetical protein